MARTNSNQEAFIGETKTEIGDGDNGYSPGPSFSKRGKYLPLEKGGQEGFKMILSILCRDD